MPTASASGWDKLADNHIAGRDWDKIRNVWSAAAIEFQTSVMSDLSQVIEPILSPGFDAREHVSVFEFVGGEVAGFHDAASGVLKCAYVLRSVGNCLISGQPTWASVDAYHFSLLACRALLGLLGIYFVKVSDTWCVLDVFPRGRLEQVQRAFRKSHPSAQFPARLFFRSRGSVIEQRAMWIALLRAFRVSLLPDSVSQDVDIICRLGEGFGRSRNEMLYGNARWLYDEDYSRPCTAIVINDDIHSYAILDEFFTDNRDANFAFAAALVRVLLTLTAEVKEQSGVDILQTSYGHCLARFPGFGIGSLNALFSGLYHRDAYGVDL
jgi:hypothetical protein